MRISGTTGIVAALLALGAVGGGVFVFRNMQETRRQELQLQAQQVKLKAREADAKAKEGEARARESEARKAEAERKRSEAEAEAKRTDLATKRQEEANLKERSAADAAAAKRAEAERKRSEAEIAKAEAVKKAAEAEQIAQAKKAEVEAVALRRVEEERRKAEIDYAKTAAAKSIADAALAKSENERKTAEATAAAEHDRKLRMYSRANTSRAELLALQRAEHLLALEESGALQEPNGMDNGGGVEAGTSEMQKDESCTNVAVTVVWPVETASQSPAEKRVEDVRERLDNRARATSSAAARRHIDNFAALVRKATAEGRVADAAYYRATLISLVPDYVSVYRELMEDARKSGEGKVAERRLGELVELVPPWQRISVFVQLIHHDEAYYSRMLAGRINKDEYVKTFRKICDEVRRDKGDRDERDAKVEHFCKILATYVPDFEDSTEWK